MATRTEDRFGEATSLGTTYTLIATVATSHTYNLLVNVTNRTASASNLRLYIADTSWSTGEPTGGTLKVAVAYDLPIAAGDVVSQRLRDEDDREAHRPRERRRLARHHCQRRGYRPVIVKRQRLVVTPSVDPDWAATATAANLVDGNLGTESQVNNETALEHWVQVDFNVPVRPGKPPSGRALVGLGPGQPSGRPPSARLAVSDGAQGAGSDYTLTFNGSLVAWVRGSFSSSQTNSTASAR